MSTNVSVKTMEQIKEFMLRKNLPLTAGQLSRLRGGNPKHNREILNEMVARGLIGETSKQQNRYKPIEDSDKSCILKVYYSDETTPINRHELGVSESVSRLIKCLSGLERTGDIDWMNGGWLTSEEASFTVPHTNVAGKPDALLQFPYRYGGEERGFVDTVELYVEYDRATKKPRVAAEQMFNYARFLDGISYGQWHKGLYQDIRPKLLFITVKESQARKGKAALEELARKNEHIYGDILSRVYIWITWAGEAVTINDKRHWFVDERWGRLADNIWTRAGSNETGFFLDESFPPPLEGKTLNHYRLLDAKRHLRQNQYDGKAYYEVGVLQYLQGEDEEARSSLGSAEKYGFESDDLFYKQGMILNLQNEEYLGTRFAWVRRDGAKNYFLKALDLNPGHQGALSELAVIRAQEELEKAAKKVEEEIVCEALEESEEELEESISFTEVAAQFCMLAFVTLLLTGSFALLVHLFPSWFPT